jgi:transcriptional regulator with XRE-family HTH domain
MLTTPPDSPLRLLLRSWRAQTVPEDVGVVRGPQQTEDSAVAQEQTARKLGCTLPHYAAVETGHVVPSYPLLHALAVFFGLDDVEKLALLDALISASRTETWAAQAC